MSQKSILSIISFYATKVKICYLSKHENLVLSYYIFLDYARTLMACLQ